MCLYIECINFAEIRSELLCSALIFVFRANEPKPPKMLLLFIPHFVTNDIQS